ncbi:MAG: GUN4 domain-containing protein [Crocosphaera sp.]|nr:GUN4 domain-containing protein [Crocosphaera sp.]
MRKQIFLIVTKRLSPSLIILCLIFIALKIYRSNQPKDINYANLEKLLSIQDWEGADYETSMLMQNITNRSRPPLYEVERFLNLNQFHRPIIVSEIPCEDLLKIDKLWTQYSENRLGFTAQRAMLKPLDSNFTGNTDINTEKFSEKFREKLKWEDYYYLYPGDEEHNKKHYQKTKNTPLTKIPYGYLPYKLYSDTYSLKVIQGQGYVDMTHVIASTVKKVVDCSKK